MEGEKEKGSAQEGEKKSVLQLLCLFPSCLRHFLQTPVIQLSTGPLLSIFAENCARVAGRLGISR